MENKENLKPYRFIRLSPEDQLVKSLRALIKTSLIGSHEIVENIWAEVHSELANQQGGDGTRFEISPKMRVIYQIWNDLNYYSNFGIEPADYLDVLSKAMEFVDAILATDYSYLEADTRDANVRYRPFESMPGYQEFIEFAQKRFKEISRTPKYIKGLDNDPIGQ